ncbi:binding-protein-dependent transport systems inner membrane component [Haladaptatus paucihalophilus DX253]|uniref:Binding-protein-dependent transport systems inner membrane component n=1 Tax=Haladaptatus paucihalophilus DX253 TaxID=797209 RepID=E7QR76_HALPU|nr:MULTISPECIES: sugar ABC transporter permease [Haladaptatus]EFW92984.1 binding-protein-dependent transport systems inner membrane component [Haladaptatus paucihalophilus DX253]GKZ15783.1 sugar transporter [Haladaptatus sp. T7]SHL17549.1 carbohydrate ABC transporter membrane protein 1, CUT1 family [Haladaptatus paucihalophilus DX253]
MSIRSTFTRGAQALENPVFDRDDLPLLLVLPGLFLFSAFMFYPILYSVYLSFTDATNLTLFTNSFSFVGFENYANVLFGAPHFKLVLFGFSTTLPLNEGFWNSMGISWLFVATSVSLKVALSIGIALVLTNPYVIGRRYMRSLIIIPMGLPTIFTITVWRGIFSNARYGLANQVLNGLHLQPILWLDQRWTAFLAYNITEAWLAYPFMVIIIVSALQDVPEELHDAAMVDGAGFFNRFLHVTLPSIKRPVLFASILTAAASFQQFLIPYVMNKGGPLRQNELLIVYGYREAFRFDKYGKGAAIMTATLVVISGFMFLNVKRGRLAEGVDE